MEEEGGHLSSIYNSTQPVLLYAVEWSMNWETDICQNQSICSVMLSSFKCICKAYEGQTEHLQVVFCVPHVFIIFSHVSKEPEGCKCVWQTSQPEGTSHSQNSQPEQCKTILCWY